MAGLDPHIGVRTFLQSIGMGQDLSRRDREHCSPGLRVCALPWETEPNPNHPTLKALQHARIVPRIEQCISLRRVGSRINGRRFLVENTAWMGGLAGDWPH